ncbi:MAG: ATP-binding protein [Mesorhizobium sp.]|nr:ATP-binding protein [Mesorhizobium sp.]MBN9243415.1 ATP-binding protein [Mesorhizobium sp.]
MTHTQPNVNPAVRSPAAIKNVSACLAVLETLRRSPPGIPNMGIFSGASGVGKTVASVYAQNVTNSAYIEVFESWGRRKFCEALLKSLGVFTPRGGVSEMMDEVVRILGDDPSKAVIIDEAHMLINRGMLQLAREVNKRAGSPMLLVGEEKLPAQIALHDNVDNLVLDEARLAAQPCDLADARVLAKLLYPQIAVADDLLDAVCAETRGCTRRVASTLSSIATFARNRGRNEIDLAGYEGRIHDGLTQRRRPVARAA